MSRASGPARQSQCGPHGGQGDGRTAGQLFLESRILCDDPAERHRVLELLYCEQCGTTLFGGSRMPLADGGGWELLTADPDIEGIPDRQAARFVEGELMTSSLSSGRWGTFAPHRCAAVGSSRLSVAAQEPKLVGHRPTLDPTSGRVQLGSAGIDGEVSGYLFLLSGCSPPGTISALPSVCPGCGQDYSPRRFRKSPIRGFRTGFSKLTQLLSKELFYLIPGGTDGSRKLVLFSDSREEAASLANGVERSHYLDLVREALYDELATLALGEPLLLEDLAAGGQATSPPAVRFAAAHLGAVARLGSLLRCRGARRTSDRRP